jgi:hypothetical protein
MTILASVNNKTLMPGITPIADVPDRPTIGTATGVGLTASITFTAATTGGTPTTFTATSNPGSLTGTASSSPITVSNLEDGTSYTFTVTAGNSTGTSPASAASNSITAISPLEGAYDALATVIVPSGGLSSITFGGIPSGYKHLQLRWIGFTDDTAGSGLGNVRCSLFFNGDTTTTNYYNHDLKGNGTSPSSAAENTAKFAGNAVRNSMVGPGANIVNMLDYSSITKNKIVRTLTGFQNNDSNDSNEGIRLVSGSWNNTSAINSIQLVPESGNFKLYTSVALYGVK